MDVYMYKADLHCIDCGIAIKHKLHKAGDIPSDIPNESSFDSDDYPKGLYSNGGGEADCPQHCGTCGVFLENPLTNDGQEYVRQALKNDEGNSDVLQEWSDFYDYLDIDPHDIKYCVETRDMHTAIHILYEAENKDAAECLDSLVQSLERLESDLGLHPAWEQVNNLIQDRFEINFREVENPGGEKFIILNDTKYIIVNQFCIDVY